jgi:hypothetical protein
MSRKKSLVGYVNKRFKNIVKWFPGRFDCYYLDTDITRSKFDKDDIKVSIVITELPPKRGGR